MNAVTHPQVMGNRPETWAKYYDLRKYVREGQDALLGMKDWRLSMEALLVRSEEDAADELDASATAEVELVSNCGAHDEITIILSSDDDEDIYEALPVDNVL